MKRLLTVALKWLPLEVAKSKKQRKRKEFFGMAEGPESRPVHRRAQKAKNVDLYLDAPVRPPKVDLYTDALARPRK